MGKRSKRKKDSDTLPPKPPETLQKIKWVLVHGSKHKTIIAIGVMIFILAWLANTYDVISLRPGRNIKDLIGVSVLIFYEADQSEDAQKMVKKLNSIGVKAKKSRNSLPSNRTAGVVYYLHPSKFDAADALYDLFPKMKLSTPELLEFHQSAYEGTDVFLYLP